MTETSDPLEIGVGAGPVELDWIHVAEVHDDDDDLFIRSERDLPVVDNIMKIFYINFLGSL